MKKKLLYYTTILIVLFSCNKSINKQKIYTNRAEYIKDWMKTVKNTTNETNQLLLYVYMTDLMDLKKLLDNGYNVNYKNENGDTALIIASYLGYADIVKMLLEYNPDLNIKNNNNETAIQKSACTLSNKDIYDMLKNRGAIIDIFSSCYYSDIESVKDLLKSGIDINIKNYLDQTPIMFSVINYNPKLFDLLIMHKANIKLKDKFGRSILFYAKLSNNIDIINYIQTKGINE
jgi:uncharacterized protein